MKRWHKFVLVLSVFSVLFSSFVVSSFASSYFEGDGDTTYQPLFFPDTMTLYSASETICFDLNTSICVDSSNGFRQYYTSSSVGDFPLLLNISYQDSIPSSLYGYTYIDVGYTFHVPAAVNDNYEIVTFTFPDLYLTEGVLGADFFGGVSVYYGEEGNEFTSYSCSWVESYIDDNGEFFSFSRSFEFSGFNDLISYYANGDYPFGVALSDITFDIYVGDASEFSSYSYVTGGSPCTSILDTPSALFSWSEFYQPTTIIVDSPPLTILQSVQVGLDAVWNTSLFGLFTIGQVFSACAGVALFTWLLKIFNR